MRQQLTGDLVMGVSWGDDAERVRPPRGVLDSAKYRRGIFVGDAPRLGRVQIMHPGENDFSFRCVRQRGVDSGMLLAEASGSDHSHSQRF